RRSRPPPARASGDQDRAAVVAVREGLATRALDLLRLDARDRQVAPLARGSDETRHARSLRQRTAAVVLLDQRGVDAGRNLVAGRPFGLHLGDELRLGLGQRRGEAVDVGGPAGALLLPLGQRPLQGPPRPPEPRPPGSAPT